MQRRTKTINTTSDSPNAVSQRSVEGNGTEWSPAEFARAVATTSEPANLSNDELFRFCQGAHRYWFHYLTELRPFFIELWHRIEARSIPNIRTKTEACRLIGCSLRWAEEIVAGTAHDPKSSAKPEPTDDEIALEISRYADDTLSVVKAEDWGLYQEICERLARHFDKQAKHEVRSGGPKGKT